MILFSSGLIAGPDAQMRPTLISTPVQIVTSYELSLVAPVQQPRDAHHAHHARDDDEPGQRDDDNQRRLLLLVDVQPRHARQDDCD